MQNKPTIETPIPMILSAYKAASGIPQFCTFHFNLSTLTMPNKPTIKPPRHPRLSPTCSTTGDLPPNKPPILLTCLPRRSLVRSRVPYPNPSLAHSTYLPTKFNSCSITLIWSSHSGWRSTSVENSLHLSRELYKSTTFYAKQTQFSQRPNQCNPLCRKGL